MDYMSLKNVRLPFLCKMNYNIAELRPSPCTDGQTRFRNMGEDGFLFL